jgi:hypothetical protein
MKSTEALINAIDIMQDRGKVYGHPKINQGRIAARLSCLLDYPITDSQAALAMVEVKLARITETPSHTDSYIDAIAYLAKMYSGEPATKSVAVGGPISVAKASSSTSITSILRRIGMDVGVCSK